MAKVMVVGSMADSLVGFRGALLQEMSGLGHEVIACAPENSAEVAAQLSHLGARYQPLPLQRTGMNPLQDLYSLFCFANFFRHNRPDVVLNYTIKPTIYGSIGAALAQVKTISSMVTGLGSAFACETFSQRLFSLLAASLYRIGLHSNRVVFFQNPDDMSLFVRRGIVSQKNRPTLINGSGVDLDHYVVKPLPKEPVFLLIARLIREKGIREYAEAARIIKRKYPNASFRLVGSIDTSPRGISVKELEGWCASGLIDYLGRLDDVRPALAEASVYVLPSFYGEGVPRSILEAMAMGRPIITTDAPGCRETVIPGRNGFLVPVHDIMALALAMEHFLLYPGLIQSMGMASRQLAEAKFNVHDVNRIILQELELWHETAV